MAETDVEIILREIRERVLAEQRAGKRPQSTLTAGNGNQANEARTLELRPVDDTLIAEKLALLNAHLTTLARAWDRLPAIVSYRSGLAARIELWIKRQLKRTTRWYSWEQVNFNASVHQSIRDILEILRALEANQLELQSSQSKLVSERQVGLQRQQEDIERHHQEISELRLELETSRATLESLRSLSEQQSRIIENQRLETKAQVAYALSELRDRIEHLQDEHRVAFKQLSLEASETSVLEDRARRQTESLIEELKQRVDDLKPK